MYFLPWVIFLTPFAIAVLIFAFLLNKPKLAGIVSTLGMLVCFGLCIYETIEYRSAYQPHTLFKSAWSWLEVGTFNFKINIILNGLTLLMALLVTGIGALVFLYSMHYMCHEKNQSRYFASLSLFIFSMLGIVFSGNLFQTYIFWELVGLSSYLLIGFWYEKPSAAVAAKKAFLTTRLGDVGMLIGILMLAAPNVVSAQWAFDFYDLEAKLHIGSFSNAWLTVALVFLFMGIVGKSAQMPLHVWLPDAMEGPTPVSALIHAATMVAAGVFLLARLFPIFSLSETALCIIAWVGGISAFLTALVAVFQNDIKKILAYSTLSQLGYMVMAMGLSNPYGSMFHLTTHAFFKALLFLGAGSLIHSLHTQDIWEIGQKTNVKKSLPITTATFLIGSLALIGMPPFSGFYSKEIILGNAAYHSFPLYFLAALTVFVTSLYISRLCWAVFFSKSVHAEKIHESNWKITLPLIILAVFSAIAGFIPWTFFIERLQIAEHHDHPSFVLILSLGMTVAGIISAWFCYGRQKPKNDFSPVSQSKAMFLKGYGIDQAYDQLIRSVINLPARFFTWLDSRILLEGFFTNLYKGWVRFGEFIKIFQNGIVQFYILLFLAGSLGWALRFMKL